MQPSMFNVRVPMGSTVAGSGEVFLMNTLTDAQLIVSRDVAALLDRLGGGDAAALDGPERDALETLAEHGFVVDDRAHERRRLEQFFQEVRDNDSELRVTVLTTLQCNFACDYCIQGDHGDYNKHAAKMTLETAARVADWCEAKLDAVRPERFVLTLFGGEPLLNLPVAYDLAERLWRSCDARGVTMLINIITNGLLLTPDVVDRLLPFGLNGVKITLDGDQATHDRMRPLRGGQGTFDRIVKNIRNVAGKCRVAIGGNFDAASVDSYPALLDFLREQDFAPRLSKVSFKPVISQSRPADRNPNGEGAPVHRSRYGEGGKFIALTPVGETAKPLNGACMTSAGGGTSACDSCHFADEQMAFLREETMKRGFPTADGVHMGPCEIHHRHAHTIGPDGSLYACPGFAGEAPLSTGHIDGRADAGRSRAAEQFQRLAAWKACHDCAFIPVCAGGCTAAAHAEQSNMHAPSCHKASFEAGLVTLAKTARAHEEGVGNR